ncbi:hypothetical protein E4T56_gene12491 [Termitomyces sp. T112]|nr:hypothetical protein E4T56_gene12491 [Termitomyces sp. T112]
METSLSESDLLVSRLHEGVQLAKQLHDLNTQGRIQDSHRIQSITEDLDKLCNGLSGSQEITYVDCKWLDSCVKTRLKYVESIEKWISQARAMVEAKLAAHGSTVEAIAFKVFDLERRFEKKGIDVQSMTQARLSSSSSVSDGAESSVFTEASRNNPKEFLNGLEEKYRETFRQMDEYEKSRAEDALRMEKLDTESANLVQRIKERLRVIQNDENPAVSVSFSQNFASVLISDKMTDLVADKVNDCVNFIDTFAQLEIDNLRGGLAEDIWKQIQPTLTLVDVVEPRRRVVDLDCPACLKLGSITAHARHAVRFARPIQAHLSFS